MSEQKKPQNQAGEPAAAPAPNASFPPPPVWLDIWNRKPEFLRPDTLAIPEGLALPENVEMEFRWSSKDPMYMQSAQKFMVPAQLKPGAPVPYARPNIDGANLGSTVEYHDQQLLMAPKKYLDELRALEAAEIDSSAAGIQGSYEDTVAAQGSRALHSLLQPGVKER